MTRTQNVGRPTYAQEIPGHLQETNQPQPVFSDQELDTYFDTVENPSTMIFSGMDVNNRHPAKVLAKIARKPSVYAA